MKHQQFRNTLLKSLSIPDVQLLALKPVKFDLMHEIEFPGELIDKVYFLETGMASMTTTFSDGAQVEVGMFGYESVIGISAMMGVKRSLNRVYTQIEGYGYFCSLATAKREFDRAGQFQKVALGYVQAQLLQASQSAGCNAKHDVHQRLARWLLTCADRADSSHFKMSQEFMADMLGSSRSTVSEVAGHLKEKDLISYSRGEMELLDLPGLRKASCECYGIITDYLETYADYEDGTISDPN